MTYRLMSLVLKFCAIVLALVTMFVVIVTSFSLSDLLKTPIQVQNILRYGLISLFLCALTFIYVKFALVYDRRAD